MSENKPHDPNNDPSLDTFILAVLELNQFLVPGAASTARAAVLLLCFSCQCFFFENPFVRKADQKQVLSF